MRQYTTPEQTAKLIELGFAEPKGHFCKVVRGETPLQDRFTFDCNYTIGELIVMLPMTIIHEIWFGEDKGKKGVWGLRVDTAGTEYGWDISYERPHSVHLYLEGRSELIDALFDMAITLKEEGVI